MTSGTRVIGVASEIYAGTGVSQPAERPRAVAGLDLSDYRTGNAYFRASTEELTNFFNIHSGGSTIQLQVQTFKAMADNARFEGASQPGSNTAMPSSPVVTNVAHENGMPALHIDLHIHLPENKSRTDYDSIFASIAEHILGKKE